MRTGNQRTGRPEVQRPSGSLRRLAALIAVLVIVIGAVWLARGWSDTSTIAVAPVEVGRDATAAAARDDVQLPERAAVTQQAQRTTAITVATRAGEPIRDATVEVGPPTALGELGRTGADGRLVIESVRVAGRRVSVRAAHFLATERTLPDPAPSAEAVVLDELPRITGTVVDANGSSAPEGVLVLAWDAESGSDGVAEARGALANDPASLHVLTDAQGRFVIEFSEPSHVYYLIAGGRGFMSAQASAAVPPGAADLGLTVHRVLGAVLRFVDDGGSPVAPSPSALSAFDATISGAAGLSGIASWSPAAILADVERQADAVKSWKRTVLFETRSGESEVAGNSLKGTLPGFERIDATFVVRSIEAGLPVQDVVLTRGGADEGQVRVVFEWEASMPAELASQFMPEGVLVLSDAERKLTRYPLLGNAAAEHVITVPIGSYGARFVGRDGGLQFPKAEEPPTPLEVTPHGCDLRVPIHGLGSVRVSIEGHDPDAPLALTLELSRGAPQTATEPTVIGGRTFPAGINIKAAIASYSFDRAPALIRGLRPGTYCIEPSEPFTLTLVDPADCVVEVRAGEVAQVRLRAP